MLTLMAGPPRASDVYHVLALGAHSDDIEIGAAGTLAALVATHPTAMVHWVVFSNEGERGAEAEASARALLGDSLASLHLHEVRDGFLPREWGGVKELLLQLSRSLRPDVVFAPSLPDAHQDHRTLAELAWQAFRGALILAYEIPSWDGNRTTPSLYVPLSPEIAELKINHILKYFPSQQGKQWFDDETFRSMLRIRGVECGARYAEGFDARKVTFNW